MLGIVAVAGAGAVVLVAGAKPACCSRIVALPLAVLAVAAAYIFEWFGQRPASRVITGVGTVTFTPAVVVVASWVTAANTFSCVAVALEGNKRCGPYNCVRRPTTLLRVIAGTCARTVVFVTATPLSRSLGTIARS